jgi:hypothetical protein
MLIWKVHNIDIKFKVWNQTLTISSKYSITQNKIDITQNILSIISSGMDAFGTLLFLVSLPSFCWVKNNQIIIETNPYFHFRYTIGSYITSN